MNEGQAYRVVMAVNELTLVNARYIAAPSAAEKTEIAREASAYRDQLYRALQEA